MRYYNSLLFACVVYLALKICSIFSTLKGFLNGNSEKTLMFFSREEVSNPNIVILSKSYLASSQSHSTQFLILMYNLVTPL